MACSITLSGIGLSCGDAIGGIKEVYIAPYSDVDASGYTVGTHGEITAITMQASKKFKHFQFRKATGSLSSAIAKNDQAGSQVCTTTLSLQFNKFNDATIREEMTQLAVGNLVVIVKTNDNGYLLLGYDNEVTATNVGAQSGQAFEDGAFYTIELTDISRNFPPVVDDSVITNTLIDFNA